MSEFVSGLVNLKLNDYFVVSVFFTHSLADIIYCAGVLINIQCVCHLIILEGGSYKMFLQKQYLHFREYKP